jgi:nitrate/nitrite transporter NarK
VREELRLAQLEMQQKAKHAGIGAGLFGAAGVVALFGTAVLVACVVLLLAAAMDAWLAALIVAVVLLAAAGAMALAGKKEVAEAVPAKPEHAIDSVHDDIDEIKARSGR